MSIRVGCLRLLISGAFFAASLLTTGCGGGASGEPSPPSNPPIVQQPAPTAIAVSAYSNLGNGKVTVTVSADAAATLNNFDVIRVSGTGGVQPVGYDGDYTISDKASNSFSILASYVATPQSLGAFTVGGGVDSGPCASSGAPISLAVAPSRLKGVAPLAVFFDAAATTAPNLTSIPFHDLEYRWNFGESVGPGITNWTNGSALSSRNLARGPIAAHIFETPGIYSVHVTAVNGSNVASNSCVQIAVQQPEVVYAGANTVCVSRTGTFPPGDCPAGATQVTSSNFSAIISSNAAPRKRLLFRRGEVFDASSTSSLTVTGPGTIGAFPLTGPGQPVVQAVGGAWLTDFAILNVSGPTTPNIADWRLMDLKLDGLLNPINGINLNGGVNQLTVLRVATSNLKIGLLASASILDVWNSDANQIRHGHAIWDQFSVVDSSVTNILPVAGYGAYLAGDRVFFAGNSIDGNGNAVPGVSHNVRFTYAGKTLISHNTLQHPGPSEHSIKLYAPDFGTTTAESRGVGGGYSRWVAVSDNKFVGASNAYSVALAPVNAQVSDQRMQDFIVERNWFQAGPGSQVALLVNSASDVTVRNNLFDTSGGLSHTSVAVGVRGVTQLPPSNVRVYNNTMYSGDPDNDFVGVSLDATPTNVIINNNLAYAPLDTFRKMIVSQAAFTAFGNTCDVNNCSVRVDTDPKFTSTPPITTGQWKPTLGSYAIGGGISVPVWSDFFLVDTTGASDIGAVRH